MSTLERMNAWAARHPIPRWFLVTWWVLWIGIAVALIWWSK